MSAWSWLVLVVGLWVFQAPLAAVLLAKWLKNNIENDRTSR
ncbi:hypothetical protein [Glutamicibacter soli]